MLGSPWKANWSTPSRNSSICWPSTPSVATPSPSTLLTEEAFQIYLREMKAGGIIAVHITNAYFDLRPMLKRVAEHFSLHYLLIHTDGDNTITTYSDWVLLSRDDKVLASLPPSTGGLRSPALRENLSIWTDDYSNLFWLLRR
jgi:hypothetical protein